MHWVIPERRLGLPSLSSFRPSRQRRSEDIAVQSRPNRAITPVAHLAPVLVAGSVVSRATLHNHSEIKGWGLKSGTRLLSKKAGDVIPKLRRF